MRVMGPLLRGIGRLFRASREGAEEPGEGPREELWSPDRLDGQTGRFSSELGRSWEAAWREGRLDLELSKSGLLAWSSAESYIYDDFFLEAGKPF